MAVCQTPTPNCLSYERGSQAFVFQSVSTTQTQSGTAAPANGEVYGIVPIVSRGQMPYNMAVQVDVSAGTFDGAASEIDILGSVDGVNFYVIDKITGPAGTVVNATKLNSASGGLVEIAAQIARYITVAIPNVGTGRQRCLSVFRCRRGEHGVGRSDRSLAWMVQR